MADIRLDTQELHERFLADLGGLAVASSDPSEKPLEMELAPPLPERTRAYVFNLTSPPGGRPSGEHKIQLIAPGQSRDSRGDFDFSEDAFVVLAGYSEAERVYVLWDARLHRSFRFSANVQVKGETVSDALVEGLSVQQRQLRLVDALESVFVVPASNLVDGLLARLAADVTELTDSPFVPPSERSMGVRYRVSRPRAESSKLRVFEVDPDLFDRATDAHAATQDTLADHVARAGFESLSPSSSDPQFDLAWINGEIAYVVEVKSLTFQNEVRQMRYAIGQVLSYSYRLAWEVSFVRPVIALERPPSEDYWRDLCAEIGIDLVWPDVFDQLFD